MTTDSGSSRSQSETHAETLNVRTVQDTWFLEATVNDVLMPKMKALGVAIPDGARFKVVDKEKVSNDEKFKRIIELKKAGFNVPKEWITEEFNIPLDEVEALAPVEGEEPKKSLRI
jgi:hypothetical protein